MVSPIYPDAICKNPVSQKGSWPLVKELGQQIHVTHVTSQLLHKWDSGGLNRFPMLEASLWRVAKIIQFYLSSRLLFVTINAGLITTCWTMNYELWTITMNPLLQIKCNNAVKNLHLKHNLNPNSQASPAGCQLKNMSSCGPEGNPFRKKAIADKWLNYLYTNKTWQNHSKDFKRNFESSYNVIKTCSRVKAVDTLEKNKLFIVSEIKALIGWCKTGLSGLFPIMHHS